jgi:hypothetical protein
MLRETDRLPDRAAIKLWAMIGRDRMRFTMTGDDVREVFSEILPEDVLMAAVKEAGLQQRERKLDALVLLRSMIISASTGYGGRQADVMKSYFQCGGRPVVRGGFYAWFGRPLERTMEVIRDLAFAYARRQPLDLPGVLGTEVRDWHIVDSSTVKLADELKEAYPGAGDYAALKVHKRFSIGLGTTIDYHLSPAREHDAPHLCLDESWRGLGLLCDLGYASGALLRDCETYGVKYVIRLKDNWQPKVQSITRGTVTATFMKGTDLDVLLADETLLLDGKVIDARVTIGRQAIECRLVGIPTPDNHYRFYLTNLMPNVAPRTVADLYRVRWEIESDNKLDKSCLRLDEIDARTGPAVRALVHSSMVGSIMICLLAHHHRRREAPPPRPGTERNKPPIHPQTLARNVAHGAVVIARAFELEGAAANAEWARLAALFNRDHDPNWRRSPSVLDQMRGWRISPGRPKRERIANASAN